MEYPRKAGNTLAFEGKVLLIRSSPRGIASHDWPFSGPRPTAVGTEAKTTLMLIKSTNRHAQVPAGVNCAYRPVALSRDRRASASDRAA